MSHDAAHFTNDLLGMGGTMGGVALRLKPFSDLHLPSIINNPGSVLPVAEKSFKSFTKRNFRTNLAELTGVSPGKNLEAHHVFPQKFQLQFMKKGIDIHDPRFGTWWEKSNHRSNAHSYNLQWEEFFRKNPTKDEILSKGKKLMIKQNIPVNY